MSFQQRMCDLAGTIDSILLPPVCSISELFLVLSFLAAIESGNMRKVRNFVSNEPITWKTVVSEVRTPLEKQRRPIECAAGGDRVRPALINPLLTMILFVLGWSLCNCSRHLVQALRDGKVLSFSGMGHRKTS